MHARALHVLLGLAAALLLPVAGCPQPDDDDDDVPEDADSDGYTVEVDCDDHDETIHPGADDPCDGTDQDCDLVDGSDEDTDGWSTCDDDCDDGDDQVHPTAVETNNGVDDDCDGEVDELELPCDNVEVEPNDETDSATPFGPDSEVCGLIDPAGDVDHFGMDVPAWTLVQFQVVAASEGSELVSQFAVYDAWTEDPIVSSTGSGDAELSVLFASAGERQIGIWDMDPGAGGWTHFYTLLSSSSEPCEANESEDNGAPEGADLLNDSEVLCAHIDGDDDFDYFAFTALGGETWTFDLDAYDVGSSLNAQMALLDADGATELSLDEPYWPDDPSITYTFDHPGTYFLLVESDLYGINDRGPYMLLADE
ncbi:MAG: putative metal-binding motif-containing protein [Myxococcota bacterium]|nr:putative metal-binding motif-containing protein [Myxococcota bacterium]